MTWQSLLPLGTKPEFIVVGGPTASGKSALALDLATALSGDIICCDSVQIYKGFDLGSAKPSNEEQALVPHHLFDVFSWSEGCDAAIYAAKAKEAIALVRSKGRLPIVVGGTGLYLRALLGQQWDDDIPSDQSLRAKLDERESGDLYAQLMAMDPRRAGQIHANDRFRVRRALEINLLTGAPVKEPRNALDHKRLHAMIYLKPSREILHERINARTRQMISQGLIDEVHLLLATGVAPDCKPMKSIGYKEVVAMLEGRLTLSELGPAIALATRQYSKRQGTLFNKVLSDATLGDCFDSGEIIQWIKGLI
jgi:tRNA dimethylallyltransferase